MPTTTAKGRGLHAANSKRIAQLFFTDASNKIATGHANRKKRMETRLTAQELKLHGASPLLFFACSINSIIDASFGFEEVKIYEISSFV